MKLSRILSLISKQKQESVYPKTGPKNCTEITVSDFIAILCGEKEHPDYWEEIFEEYLELTESSSINGLLELMKAEKVYYMMYAAIFTLCNVVSLNQDYPEAILVNDELRKLTGKPGKGKMNKREFSMHKNVGISYRIKAEAKAADIKKLTVNNKESTKTDWYNQLSFLSKYQGYSLMNKSVTEFCSVLNNFKRDSKIKEKNNG